MHNNPTVHRNIKPQNFLMGIGKSGNRINIMIDFGLATEYRDPKTKSFVWLQVLGSVIMTLVCLTNPLTSLHLLTSAYEMFKSY